MAEFDRKQQERIKELTDAGETIILATERVKQETREEYFRLLRDHADIPVFSIAYPAGN